MRDVLDPLFVHLLLFLFGHTPFDRIRRRFVLLRKLRAPVRDSRGGGRDLSRPIGRLKPPLPSVNFHLSKVS